MKKVYIIISRRTDLETEYIEVWDNEELAKTKMKLIYEREIKELKEQKKSKWINKLKTKFNKNFFEDCDNYYCTIDWINEDKEKRRFIIYYVEREVKG